MSDANALEALQAENKGYRAMRDRVAMVIGGQPLPPESNPNWSERALSAERERDALKAENDKLTRRLDEAIPRTSAEALIDERDALRAQLAAARFQITGDPMLYPREFVAATLAEGEQP